MIKRVVQIVLRSLQLVMELGVSSPKNVVEMNLLAHDGRIVSFNLDDFGVADVLSTFWHVSKDYK